MAIGDDAAAAGYPLVPPSGPGSEIALGYQDVNQTRDFIAQVKAMILSTWTIAKGGTGASTADGARTNLGISSGIAAPSDAVGGSVNGNIYFKIII